MKVLWKHAVHAMKPSSDFLPLDESTLIGSLSPVDADESTPAMTRASIFDACHVGVVLRAVLFVEAVVGVAAMFGTNNVLDWLLRFSLMTGGVLPATLAWLITACLLKSRLNRLAAA